jgi:hypothetical protein
MRELRPPVGGFIYSVDNKCRFRLRGWGPPHGSSYSNPASSTVDLVELLGLEYADEVYALSVDGPEVHTPWSVVFSTSTGLSPEFMVWYQRDVAALGVDAGVAVFRVSSGELLYAEHCWSAFFTFLLADDLDRLVAVTETSVVALGANGREQWIFRPGEVIVDWRREGAQLVVVDYRMRSYRIDLLDGSVSAEGGL